MSGTDAAQILERETEHAALDALLENAARGEGGLLLLEGEIYLVVAIFEFRDGKITRETRYYPQPFEAPEWRSQWVERTAYGF